MLSTRTAILGLLPALALGLLSCTTDPIIEEEESVTVDESAYTTADRSIFGTYRAIVVSPGDMPLLVLLTDGTYHRAIRMPCPTAGPCTMAQDDGTYLMAFRDGKKYLTLYSDTGGTARYEYILLGDSLRLRPLGSREFTSMTRTPEAAWCGELHDCSMQNLPEASCHGLWLCGQNICNQTCMSGPVVEPKPWVDVDPN